MLHIDGPAYGERAEFYDCFFGDRTAEIAGWAGLAAPYGRRVIEWMCGTGELACGLARAGFSVTGVDVAAEMVAVARKRMAGDAAPRWVLGDMRDLRLSGEDADFGFVPAGSFGHLLARADRERALRNARRHLRPGGALVLALSPAGAESQPETVRGPFDALRPGPGGAMVRKIAVRTAYDAATQRYTICDTVEIVDRNGTHRFSYAFQLRHFTAAEAVDLLTAAGFVAARHYGDFDQRPWQPGAPRWLVCAERPA
jgi:SAM-dependent methyltransferase